MRGAVDLEGDVVELEVEEDLEATVVHVPDHFGTIGVIKGHAHLDPACLAREQVGQTEGLVAVAVEGDDDGVAGLFLGEGQL